MYQFVGTNFVHFGITYIRPNHIYLPNINKICLTNKQKVDELAYHYYNNNSIEKIVHSYQNVILAHKFINL